MTEPKLAHESYIQWAREDLIKAIRNLEISQNESGNALTKAIINNLKSQLETLRPNHHQLY